MSARWLVPLVALSAAVGVVGAAAAWLGWEARRLKDAARRVSNRSGM